MPVDFLKHESSEAEDMELIDPYMVQPVKASLHQQFYDQESNSALSVAPDDSPLSIDARIKMEQYVNLDLIMAPVDDASFNISDELNTPIFGAGKEMLYDIMQNATTTSTQPNPFRFPLVSVKSEAEDAASAITDGNETMLDFNDNSVVSSEMGDMLLPTDNIDIYGTDDINLDEYDLLSDYRDALGIVSECVADNDTDYNYNNIISSGNVNDNNSPRINSEHNYPLKLNVNNINSNFFIPQGDDVQTPDIIKTILSIQNEYDSPHKLEAEIINPQDLIPEYPSPSISPSVTNSSIELPRKTSRRRRNTSDDDEDYIPPSKIKRHHSTSESDNDSTPAKRGRPLKLSSVHSESSEPSKYREMRDKNNEASRKSRQKRKEQEMVHEKERLELEEKNVKLKAEVTELERMVSQFRANMMELMMKK